MSTNKKHALLCGALLLLAGCANYNASSLTPLSSLGALRSAHNPAVLVSWRAYDKEDCQTYLGRNILAEGYVPIQMTVRNDSDDPMYLSTENFNIPLASPLQVAEKVHTSTAGRVAAWGAGGLVLWPLLIPAVYDGIKSSEANSSLDADYQSKALKEQTIGPHTTFNSVVFVPKEQVNQHIEMYLTNERTHEKLIFPMEK